MKLALPCDDEAARDAALAANFGGERSEDNLADWIGEDGWGPADDCDYSVEALRAIVQDPLLVLGCAGPVAAHPNVPHDWVEYVFSRMFEFGESTFTSLTYAFASSSGMTADQLLRLDALIEEGDVNHGWLPTAPGMMGHRGWTDVRFAANPSSPAALLEQIAARILEAEHPTMVRERWSESDIIVGVLTNPNTSPETMNKVIGMILRDMTLGAQQGASVSLPDLPLAMLAISPRNENARLLSDDVVTAILTRATDLICSGHIVEGAGWDSWDGDYEEADSYMVTSVVTHPALPADCFDRLVAYYTETPDRDFAEDVCVALLGSAMRDRLTDAHTSALLLVVAAA